MAVVRVRVEPRMFPPTIMAEPISAMTWPKAAVMTAARAKRASRATAQAVRQADAPSVWAVRRTRGSTPWTAAADNAAAMGSAMHTSPTAIACQVYSHPSPPSGPRRDNSPNSSKPVTTVGNARAVLTSVKAARRPQNWRVARKKPSGSPMAHAITVAVTATFRVSTTTPVTSASPARRRARRAAVLPLESPSQADGDPGMGRPLDEGGVERQDPAIVGGRLLVIERVLEPPEYQPHVGAH